MMTNNHTSTTIDMKIQFRGENRIVSIRQQADNNHQVNLYRVLKQQVTRLFQLSEQQVNNGRIQYVDDEEDLVIVDSNSELLTAIRVQREIMGQKIVKFTWIGDTQPTVTMTQQEHTEQQTEPHSAPSVDNIDITTAATPSVAQPKWHMRNVRERQLQKVQMKREIQALKQDMRQLKREQKQKSLVLKSLSTGGDSNSCGGGTTMTAITSTTTDKTASVRLAEHKMEKMKKRMQLKMDKKMEMQLDREAKRIFKLNSRAITQSLKRGEFPTHITSLVIDAETMVKNIRKLQLKSEDEYSIEHLCQTLIHLLVKLTEQCIRDNHQNLKMKILVPTPEFASVMERWIQKEQSSAVLNTDNVQIVSALPTYTNVGELLTSVVQAMVNESSGDDSAKNSILLVSNPKNVQQSVSENPNLNFVFCRRMVKYLLPLAGMCDMKSKQQKKFELKHHGHHHHHRHSIENSGGPHFVANI